MRVGDWIYRGIAAGCVVGALAVVGVERAGGQGTPAAGGGGDTGAKFLAGRLVEDARGVLRDGRLTPGSAAKRAAILLSVARKLEEQAGAREARTLKMLVEAARAADKPVLLKEALRSLIELDKGDLVAQVQYIDLLAGATQVYEERARVYGAALEQAGLDVQIRSEVAVRLAQLAEEHGDVAGEKQYFTRALALNDVNVAALRGLVRLAANNPRAVSERMGALVALLTADPYQPDAWMELARICATANLHERAAQYLTTSMEQTQLQGVEVMGESYLELGMERAIAGPRAQGVAIVNGLAKLPDAPLSVLIVAALMGGEQAAASAPASAPASVASTEPMKQSLEQRIRAMLADMVKNAPDGDAAARALANAAGVELTVLPTVSADAASRIEAYAKLVSPEDTTLARLRGWQLYRAGRLDEAKAVLEKVAGADPMSAVGLARVLIAQGKKQEALKQLQDVWASHPPGLLALQVMETARLAGDAQTKLGDTSLSKELEVVAGKLPVSTVTAHRQPREMVLASVNVGKGSVGIGEPAMMGIQMVNTTDRALPVGPGGVVVTTVGVSAEARGADAGAAPLGIYAVEELQRVYRLEAHRPLEATVRIDQGALARVMDENPLRAVSVNVKVTTAPLLLTNKQAAPGLGGQELRGGDITRAGYPIGTGAGLEKLRQELGTFTGQERLVRIGVAGAILNSLGAGKPVDAGAVPEEAKKVLVEALVPLAKSEDALVRATLLDAVRGTDAGELDNALDGLGADVEPVVRMLWAVRQGKLMRLGGDAGKAARTRLDERVAVEKDEMVREWMGLVMEETSAPATTLR